MPPNDSLPQHIAGGLGVPQQAFLAALQQIALELSAQTQVLSPTGLVRLVAISTPAAPPAGQFLIYMDAADNKLKAIGPDGTITDIANP